jgi:hypothetical protein
VTQATNFAELAAEMQRHTLATLKQAQDLSFAFAGEVLQQQKAYALRMTEIVTGAAAPAPAKTK